MRACDYCAGNFEHRPPRPKGAIYVQGELCVQTTIIVACPVIFCCYYVAPALDLTVFAFLLIFLTVSKRERESSVTYLLKPNSIGLSEARNLSMVQRRNVFYTKTKLSSQRLQF